MFYLKSQRASIMLVAVLISASIMTLFVTVSYLSKQYQKQVSSLEYWNLAENKVESSIEEAIVRYFEKSEGKYQNLKSKKDWKEAEWRREEILYWNISENKNELTSKKIDWKIKLAHTWVFQAIQDSVWIWEVWKSNVEATRLVDTVEAKINPFSSYEFRLTAEEREKKWTWKQEDVKQLKITWNKLNWDPAGAGLEIIQASWPINQNWNIQTHRISFENWGTYTFWDFRKEEDPEIAEFTLPSDSVYSDPTTDTNLEKFEYIFVFKAKVYPLVLNIVWLDSAWNEIQLPDRFAYFKAEAQIWGEDFNLGWENVWRTYKKSLETKKEIYTDFDSNFDYARNFVN